MPFNIIQGGNKRDKSKMNNAEKMKIYKSLLSSRDDLAKKTGQSSQTAAPTNIWSSIESNIWKLGLSTNQQQTHRSVNSNIESLMLSGGGGTNLASGGWINVSPRRPYLSNDDLNLMCPVSLHEKLAKSRYDVPECRCRKLAPPLVRDIEFDYFIRLLPSEQQAIVVVIDSQ